MREVIYHDRVEALNALRLGNYVLEFCSDELRADKEIVMLEMQMDGVDQFETALEFASKEIRADKEVVLAALKWDGYSIRYASEALKNDREVAMAAVQNDIYGVTFDCIGEELQNDREIILEALNCNATVFNLIPEAFQNDPVVQFVHRLMEARCFVGDELLGDDEDEGKTVQCSATHARHWQVIKQVLLEKPDFLVNYLTEALPAGLGFYNSIVGMVLNQSEIEPCQLPMFEFE